VILQIYRDRLTRSLRPIFDTIERDAAAISAELRFPHAHFAMEAEGDPLEVWWINAFESEADRTSVETRFLQNRPCLEGLEGITARREQEGIGAGEDLITQHRADLSGAEWEIEGIRFFVTRIVEGARGRIDGVVFQALDGRLFVLRPARTRNDAEALALASGPDARIFALQPQWGMPAASWVNADPDFWRPSPMASRSR
jgi:hypothetical protein